MGSEAQESPRAQRAFLAHLRHELRTPLNAILGYSEMLIEDAPERGHTALLTDLRRIHAAGGELLALVNEILAPEQIDAGALDGDLESVGVRLRHDLLTPLNAILGYSEMLLEDAAAQGAADALADLHKVRAAAQRFLALINDVVALSRLRGGTPSPDLLTDAAAAEMIQGVVTTIRPLSAAERQATEHGTILLVD
ncbi:MAG: hypothetical protein NZT92_14000, partial [Abditibacteriales bacterium]|nr:hypothetical protein [Abditibacteriales bacterium]MDW8367030.1 histidine kinase dimerization/phospho-acceptor domain-containing protein [Abditibacteriales bacterium]